MIEIPIDQIFIYALVLASIGLIGIIFTVIMAINELRK